MSYALRLLIAILLPSLLLVHFAAADAQLTFEPLSITPPSKVITNLGESRQPIFISNDSFIFISKNRKYHTDPQIYFKDLKNGREKRITHQRGHIINGVWVDSKHKIIYASTTDEESETPLLLKSYLERFPSSVGNNFFFHIDMSPSEIYSSLLDGTEIKRLSKHSGFDAFPSFLKGKNRLLFSRFEDNQINIFAKSTKKHLKPWKVMKTKGNDLGLQLSPKQDQFTWYRFSPDFKSAQLMLANTEFANPQYLALESGISWSPSWHPNNKTILYSAKLSGAKGYDLYEVSVAQGCKRQITSYDGDEFYPAVSPDGSKLLFTATQEGKEQIHQIAYPEPFACD